MYKMHHLFDNKYIIIDSKKEIPTIECYDHDGYLLEKYNEWDSTDNRFFICHNSNGDFQIVDSDESNPIDNKWKAYSVPKKETAIELCKLLNDLNN